MQGVFMQTNEEGTNRVLAFARAADGTLAFGGKYDDYREETSALEPGLY